MVPGQDETQPQKRRGRPSRPSVVSLAGMLKLQNEYLFGELDPFPRARLRHLVEVAICPAYIREAMAGIVGVAFTTAAASTELSRGFVPAEDVFVQALGMSSGQGGRLIPMLREFDGLVLGEHDGGFVMQIPNFGMLYNFEFDLSSGGCGLPASKVSTIENGDDIHRAMEAAALASRPLPTSVMVPEGYIAGSLDSPPFDWQPGMPIPEGLLAELAWRLDLWWEKGGHEGPCQASDPSFAEPNHWVGEFVRLDMRSRLPAPMPIGEVVRTLSQESQGEPLLFDLLNAVCISCIRVEEGKAYFPISLFPVHPRSIVYRKRREIRVRFDETYLGRDSFTGLTRGVNPAAGAIQVAQAAVS